MSKEGGRSIKRDLEEEEKRKEKEEEEEELTPTDFMCGGGREREYEQA